MEYTSFSILVKSAVKENKKLLMIVSEDWYFYTHRFELVKKGITKGFNIALLTNFTKYKEILSQNNIILFDWNKTRGRLNLFREIKTLLILYSVIKFSI